VGHFNHPARQFPRRIDSRRSGSGRVLENRNMVGNTGRVRSAPIYPAGLFWLAVEDTFPILPVADWRVSSLLLTCLVKTAHRGL